MLPDGVLDYFEPVDFKKEPECYRLYLEEKREVPSEFGNKRVRANGFMEEIKVHDFPIRDLQVILHVKRRRWLLVGDNRKVSRNWELVAPGTRMTAEFSAFLKELAR